MENSIAAGLKEFFLKAQRLHHSGDRLVVRTFEGDGSIKAVYAEDDWSYSDKHFGSTCFRGVTVVRHKGVACFLMTYGGVIAPDVDENEVNKCLASALASVDAKYPWRGPESHIAKNGLRYINTRRANDFSQFAGDEKIISNSCKGWAYTCDYAGGVIKR